MKPESPDTQLIALLDRVALADEAALRELYDLTSSKLYGVAVRVVSNREWAEDVLQEAFLNIWRIAADYKATLSPPMAWMVLVVRSRGLDFLRRRTTPSREAARRTRAPSTALGRLRGDTRGANLVEYIILVGVIALIAIAGFKMFGGKVRAKVDEQAGSVGGINGAAK